MHWSLYDQSTLWFAYEHGAHYALMRKQLGRTMGSLNHQLTHSYIRLYAHEERAKNKHMQWVRNVTALRSLMRKASMPLAEPKKSFKIDVIQSIMKRQAPWTLDQKQVKKLHLQQYGPAPDPSEKGSSFHDFCEKIAPYGLTIQKEPHASTWCLYQNNKPVKYMSMGGLVCYVNKLLQDKKSYQPCTLDLFRNSFF